MTTCPATYLDPISGLSCTFAYEWTNPLTGTRYCRYNCPDGSIVDVPL